MSESPFSFESWATAQAAMLKSMFPTPADAGSTPAAVPPLQEQFEELRDTWTESINRWSEFVKEGGAFDFSKPESLRALFAPGAMARKRRGRLRRRTSPGARRSEVRDPVRP